MEHTTPTRDKQAEPSTSSAVPKSGDHDSGVAAAPVPLPPLAASATAPETARPSEPWIVRRMKIGGADSPSGVSGPTHKKHVVAEADQATTAQAVYGSSTFVTSDDVLTGAVDADGHDFPATTARSARKDIQATLPIAQYWKSDPLPDGLKKNAPVTLDPEDTSLCEIGAEKTGDGGVNTPATISITHFKKL